MNSIKVVGIITVVVFCFIYFVINKKLRNEILDILNTKIWKIKVKDIFVILILFIIIMYSFISFIDSKNNLEFLVSKTGNQEYDYNKGKEASIKQNKRYKEIFEIKTNIENCKNPYIPEEFYYVEGEWNTGFVIEDKDKNQFVWIPCTNIKNKDNIPLLKKEVFLESNSIYFNCYEQDDYEKFLISSLENGGFYISRFEIGNENEIPVSKKDINIWTNINWKDAKKIAENMYSNINSELINGYAYDTAVNFILDEIDFKNVSQTRKITGTKAYKNVYDLIDNMNEWTSEMRYTSNLYRGSIIEDNEDIIFADRFSGSDKQENLGFRTIIYK